MFAVSYVRNIRDRAMLPDSTVTFKVPFTTIAEFANTEDTDEPPHLDPSCKHVRVMNTPLHPTFI